MQGNSKKKHWSLGLAVAVLLPLSFYLIAKALSKDKIYLPHFYIADRVDSSRGEDGKMEHDTTWHQTADILLTNHLGEVVSLNKDLKGKILAINFFFVDCPSVCPKLTNNIAILQKAFRRTAQRQSDTLVQLLSITVLPERDSVPRLRAYADAHKADPDRWWFLTGNKPAIYHYMREELGLPAGEGDGGADDFAHSQKIVLVDQERYIRGFYDGLDPVELKKCADDIVLLSIEKKHKKKVNK